MRTRVKLNELALLVVGDENDIDGQSLTVTTDENTFVVKRNYIC